MSEKSVLLVAFDGLDKELIEEFGLEHVKQEEYGSIDNKTGMHQIKTSELFTSFITGETWKKHGITGHQKGKYKNKKKEKIINFLTPDKLQGKIRGFNLVRDLLESILRVDKVTQRYTKNSQKLDTLFDKIENSRAMFVPGWNPGMIWRLKLEASPLMNGYSVDRQAKFWNRRAYKVRKRELFSELNNEIISPRNLLMCHIFKPDQFQHYYGDRDIGRFDKSKLKKMYLEIDQLAKEIKETALEQGYETIIFMSDHGLPTETAHNENAFYSCNTELFGEKTPKITDFHNKILSLVKADQQEEREN